MLSPLNFIHSGSIEHLCVLYSVLGTEASTMSTICPLFSKVHIWQGIKQSHFIVLCVVALARAYAQKATENLDGAR